MQARPAHECVDGDCSTGVCCFRHKLQSIQWSPSATPTRRNTIPPRKPNNSWERGIAKDERGVPILNSSGQPMGLKELAGNRGHVEARIRELKNTPPTTTP